MNFSMNKMSKHKVQSVTVSSLNDHDHAQISEVILPLKISNLSVHVSLSVPFHKLSKIGWAKPIISSSLNFRRIKFKKVKLNILRIL